MPTAITTSKPAMMRTGISQLTAAPRARIAQSPPDINERSSVGAARAVLYLRVSSPGQVHTDYDPEGISLPAQRKACQRKAEQLGLTVVGEYVEAGVSGRGTEHRLEFQKMLARIKTEKDVDCVIVHKLSRLARNRIDEALVMDQFNRRNVRLVSATEPIDNTPEGQFMQGILSSMAQFRSQQDGEDVAYKMGEKAKNGGTIGKAPIGYLNVREMVDGHEVRTVAVDTKLSPFIREAFELYRDGKTLQTICDELGARGFIRPATRNHPAAPLTDGRLAKILRDPYYLGFVRYKGELYPGRHEAIISQTLFDQVQASLATRGATGSRNRIHQHALKGVLWCGACHEQGLERRMILNRAHGKGGVYWHYFCNGRNFDADRHEHAPYIQVGLIETAVARYYKQVGFTAAFVAAMEHDLKETVSALRASDSLARVQAEKHAQELRNQEERLVQLAMDGTLPQEIIRERLGHIQAQRAAAEAQVDSITDDVEQGADNIRSILHFLEHPGVWYNHPLTDDTDRKQLNRTIFDKIYIHYEQDSQQTEVQDVQYTRDIQTLKDMEERFNQSGRLEDDEPQENMPNPDERAASQGHNDKQSEQHNGLDARDYSPDTLDTFTRTSTPDDHEKADYNTESREYPEQNRQIRAGNETATTTEIDPGFGGIIGVEGTHESKNLPTKSFGEQGSNKNILVPPAGLEPASLAAADFKSTASTDFAKGA